MTSDRVEFTLPVQEYGYVGLSQGPMRGGRWSFHVSKVRPGPGGEIVLRSSCGARGRSFWDEPPAKL